MISSVILEEEEEDRREYPDDHVEESYDSGDSLCSTLTCQGEAGPGN